MSRHDCTLANLRTPWASAADSVPVANLPGNGMQALLPLFLIAGAEERNRANGLLADRG